MGRYLTNTPNGTLDKAMTFDELEILLAAGLNVFPIFQTQVNAPYPVPFLSFEN